MTKMVCALTKVDSLCEIMMTVRPTAMRDKLLMKMVCLLVQQVQFLKNMHLFLKHLMHVNLTEQAATTEM